MLKKSIFFVRFSNVVFAALLAVALTLPAAAPPASAKVVFHEGGIADIKGLWLDVPTFPAAEFADDGAKRRDDGDEYGYFSFRRGLAEGHSPDIRWSLVVDREYLTDKDLPGNGSFLPVTKEKAKAFLLSRAAISEDATVEVYDDQAASAILGYPVTRARSDFLTGNGEAITVFDLFIPTDTYLFWVHLSAPGEAAARFTEADFTSWFEDMRFRNTVVNELMLEAPSYPGKARIIEHTRHLDLMSLKIGRYNVADGWGPGKPEDVPEFIKRLVRDGNGAMDKIEFDPEADARASEHFGRPCALAVYTTGKNEDTNVVGRLFIFADTYVFDVEASMDGESYDELSPIATEWVLSLQFVEQ